MFQKKEKKISQPALQGQYIGIYPARTLAPCHGPYDATTNYTWARGRSRWLGPQEAGSTPLKLELRRPSARKTTRRRYEPPPTPRSRGRGGETRQGEVARERERDKREKTTSFPAFTFYSRFYSNWLNARKVSFNRAWQAFARWSIIIPAI